MRICLVYDCLFPHTVGGAERWYRALAEALADAGHEVTYLTRRQWPPAERPDAPRGTRVVAVSKDEPLYTTSGRRRIGEALRFGAGVARHLRRRPGAYDAVHTASFPYFSVLAANAQRRTRPFALVIDWHEVWTREYWREYLGAGGVAGWAVQRACVRLDQRAFCFSRLHQRRLRDEGLRGEAIVLEGEYAGSRRPPDTPREVAPLVLYAGRHIREKRVPALVPAVAAARTQIPALRAEILGDGPDAGEVRRLVVEHGLESVVHVRGFVDPAQVEEALDRAMCLVLPSRREGYGLVVVEASAAGTPSVVVSDPDNAATELVEDGVNGVIAASASADDLADAIRRVHDGGPAMRASTAAWYRRNARRLSLRHSLDTVVEAYRR